MVQIFDAGTGLGFYNARYYDTALGKFISPDPMVSSLFDPNLFNRFTYVGNNPLAFMDPNGLTRCKTTDCHADTPDRNVAATKQSSSAGRPGPGTTPATTTTATAQAAAIPTGGLFKVGGWIPVPVKITLSNPELFDGERALPSDQETVVRYTLVHPGGSPSNALFGLLSLVDRLSTEGIDGFVFAGIINLEEGHTDVSSTGTLAFIFHESTHSLYEDGPSLLTFLMGPVAGSATSIFAGLSSEEAADIVQQRINEHINLHGQTTPPISVAIEPIKWNN